jgi:tetratricopeptide (TPR) repeat protein
MALFAAGQLSYFLGRFDAARHRLEECIAIAREIENRAIIGRVLQPLGATLAALGDFTQARLCLGEALDLACQIGDQRDMAAASSALTMLCRTQGHLEEAVEHGARAVDLARRVNDPNVVGLGLLNLVMLSIDLHSTQKLIPMLMESLDLALRTRSEPLVLGAIEVCAGLAAATSDWANAALMYGAAEARRRINPQRRATADEAFIMRRVADAEAALGSSNFARLLIEGQAGPREADLSLAMQWLNRLSENPLLGSVTSSKRPDPA